MLSVYLLFDVYINFLLAVCFSEGFRVMKVMLCVLCVGCFLYCIGCVYLLCLIPVFLFCLVFTCLVFDVYIPYIAVCVSVSDCVS